MPARLTWLLISVLQFMVVCPTVRGSQPNVAAFSAGAARLDRGSMILLGQPFVGTVGTPGEPVSAMLGLLPALLRQDYANGLLAITPNPSFAGGRFQLSFSTEPGRNYVVHVSTNLSNWTPIWMNAGTWTGLTFQDSDVTNFPQRFYRIETY